MATSFALIASGAVGFIVWLDGLLFYEIGASITTSEIWHLPRTRLVM